MQFETRCIHSPDDRSDPTGAITVPIYQSATFFHAGVGESGGYDYSRLQNPTRERLEETVAALEHGVDAIACSSGMAAISLALELFSPGSRIVVSDDLYGGTNRLFDVVSQKNGLTVVETDTSDLEAVRRAITPGTRALLIETPSNPMMKLTDIAAVAKLAHEQNALLLVDNTFLSPCLQNPLLLGADVVLHSGTKYLSGHNDTLSGFIVTADRQLAERLRLLYKTIGCCLSPFDSFLVLRGIKTLPVRIRQQQQTARALAEWLQTLPPVKKVYYPGLAGGADLDLCRRQTRGSGGMLSFEVDTPDTARRALERVRLIYFAESLGGVETLITYPYTQTHADLPEEVRIRKGITPCLLRLSVGLEDVEDLKEDLRQALEGG